MRVGAAVAICAAVLCCGCYDTFDTPNGVAVREVAPNASVRELRDMYYGKPMVVSEKIIIGGYVTSSDKAGNFYRTFTIRDASVGVEIMAGTRDLHNVYPEGCYVCVDVGGCAAGESRGVLQIGAEAESYDNFDVDYFYSKVELDRRIFRSSRNPVSIDIPVVAYSDLDRALCGCPVTLAGLKSVRPSELAENERCTWSGYRMFEDDEGRRIYTYTNAYADFADDTVPDVTVDITGILQYGAVAGESDDCFILKMRSREDCKCIGDNM